jgi:hypothetical protein
MMNYGNSKPPMGGSGTGSPSAHGLGISRGRLVNNAPPCVTGIQKMVALKKEMKKQKKIEMIAEAIRRGK